MSREVRMVTPDWQHPKDERGRFKPLLDGPFGERLDRWNEENAKWIAGFERHVDYSADPRNGVVSWVPKAPDRPRAFTDWDGPQPSQDDYMPEFAPGTATHLMMYETCTEGTPISPAFATPEELARWLADNGASAFGSDTATYEQWLATCRSGWAPSAISSPATGLISGVAATGFLK
jgi:hypothetical protein